MLGTHEVKLIGSFEEYQAATNKEYTFTLEIVVACDVPISLIAPELED